MAISKYILLNISQEDSSFSFSHSSCMIYKNCHLFVELSQSCQDGFISANNVYSFHTSTMTSPYQDVVVDALKKNTW